MMSKDDSLSINLKVLVGKDKNRVIFLESNKDFVDVLFSFMTMPIGNIVRLARVHSLEENFGCLNNLYESIVNLDEENLQSGKCKDMLLHPRSAAEIYCTNLYFNFVDTTDIYVSCVKCNNYSTNISHYSTPCYNCFGPYYNALCRCGLTMNTLHKLGNRSSVPQGGVFVKPTARFMISDDFQVQPISTKTCVALLSKFESADRSTKEERTINIGKDKVMKLLCCSLTTKAPFSEIILDSAIDKKYGPRRINQPERAMGATKKESKITLKLIVNKSNNKALYVEAKEDFVNLICSFLTYPLGSVFKKLPGLSLRGCLGNLYKSIQDLDVEEFLKSEEMKAILVNAKLARGLALHKQLIPIREASYPSYSTVSSLFKVSTDPNLTRPVEAITSTGFFREASMFMVTDDLTITHLSPLLVSCFIDRFNVPLSDILEQEVIMGMEEALCLLEAALVSKTALTDVFIREESKQGINIGD